MGEFSQLKEVVFYSAVCIVLWWQTITQSCHQDFRAESKMLSCSCPVKLNHILYCTSDSSRATAHFGFLSILVWEHFGFKPILKITMCTLYLHSLVIDSTIGSRDMQVNTNRTSYWWIQATSNTVSLKELQLYENWKWRAFINCKLSKRFRPKHSERQETEDMFQNFLVSAKLKTQQPTRYIVLVKTIYQKNHT